jgi:signal peptidase II
MRRFVPALLIAAALTTVACDRVTKRAAESMLAGKPDRAFLAGTVRLAYAENTGGFLSLGAEWPPAIRTAVFTVATGLVLLVMPLLLMRWWRSPWLALGITLFVTGGASNWIDRVTRGSVIDFLNLGIGPVRTGIFNVADVALMIGGCMLAAAPAFALRAPARLARREED